MSGDLVGLVMDRPHLPTDRVIWVRLLDAAPVSVESWLTVSDELGPWLGQVVELRRDRNNSILARVEQAVTSPVAPPAVGMPVKMAPVSMYASAVMGRITGPQITGGVILDEQGRPVAPFKLSLRHVVGPDGAHPMVSGTSGLAAKTSFSLFLLTSIQQSAFGASVATVVFNGKGSDLLRIDQAAQEISEVDHAIWDVAGLDPAPLNSVSYVLPLGKNGAPSSAHVPADFHGFGFSLKEGIEHLDALLTGLDDPAKTLAALAADISCAVQTNEPEISGVSTWPSLHSDLPLTDRGYALAWGHHRRETVRRFCREIKRLTDTGSTGIFTDGASLRTLLRKLRGGEVLVVDIAPLVPEEQAFVVAVVLRELWSLRLNPTNICFPKNVLVFIDELSKFAPRRSRGNPLLRDCLIDMAQRGRSLGLSVLGCEQGLTTVAEPMVANAALRVFGRTPSSELQHAAYRSLDPRVRAQLPHLQPGRVILDHAPAARAVPVGFPRPACIVG